MMKAILSFLFVAFMATVSGSAYIHTRCNTDSDCSEQSYCSSDMYCDPCINCEATFKRQPLELASCARVDEDCGNCLTGYQAEELHGQRHSMKCYKPSAKPISSEEPSSNLDSTNILTIFGVSLLISCFLAMALFAYFSKSIRHLFAGSRTTRTGIELDNRNLPAPDLPQDQARSHDGINETDQLIDSIQAPNELNVQVEENHLSGAIPIGPFHTDDDTLSEAIQHTVSLIENINYGSNQEANDGPREMLTAMSELSPPNNTSQTQPLPVNDEHIMVVPIPAETPDSRDPNDEQPRGRQRNETGESLEFVLAVGIKLNRQTECWTKNS
ncbi:uncharacterized protein LOC130700197 [Daphnia carinata]|uniref:uncharacterized protein LOC130700197 n=1 Tax=Daphnia carinata TaxID=120202 RepID=UPI00257E179D|nr:uncharacterized protein LOC130700197 [Daphnia carinata]